jgi:hypothetical protein
MQLLSSLFHAVWPSFVAVLTVGPVVWFATEFVARPIRRFFDLRAEIKRSMLLLWNAPNYGTYEEYEDWAEEMAPFNGKRERLTELSADISAFAQSERFAVWVVRTLKYQPRDAGDAARKLAFELGTNIEDRTKNYRKLDATLKFRFDAKRPFYNPYNPGH